MSELVTDKEASFEIRRRLTCDTIVIGGGTTGITAAIASARSGCSTILVEMLGYLGGNSTVVPSWMGFHSRDGREVIKGIPLELLNALQAEGAATPLYHDPICGSVTGINPHWWKIIAGQEIRAAGVRPLLHTRFVGVKKCGDKINAVYLFGGEGLISIDCKFVIDCTDMGIVAMESGEEMKRGRESDGKPQVSSWTFEVGEIEFPKLADYFMAHPDDMRPFALKDAYAHVKEVLQQDAFVVGAFGRLIDMAESNGLQLPRKNMPGVIFPATGKFVTVASRVENVNPGDSIAYTEAEGIGESQAEIWIDFLKQYVPGFKNCNLTGTYGAIGIRETNHLVGAYTLTANDLLTGRRFEDSIALGAYHLDIHSPDHGGLETQFPAMYTIPYRSLLPLNTSNLLVAGRAISATHEAMASTRVIPISMAEGQAAGIAAGLCVSGNIPAGKVSMRQLRRNLRHVGALIDS